MTTRQIWIELQDGTPDAESINHVRRENRGSLVEGGKARYAVHMQSLNSVVCFEVLPVDHGIRWNNSPAKPCSGLREKIILLVALLAKQRRVESKWNFWVEGDGLDVLRNLAVRTHLFVRSAHWKCGPLCHLRIVPCATPLLSTTMDRSRQVLRPSGECMPNRRFADRQSHSLHDDQQGARPERHAMHPPGGPHVIHQ